MFISYSKNLTHQKLLIRPDKFQGQKLNIMKKIIISLSLAGFVSLGFTVVVNSSSSKEGQVKTQQKSNSEKYKEVSDNNEKRLANWD